MQAFLSELCVARMDSSDHFNRNPRSWTAWNGVLQCSVNLRLTLENLQGLLQRLDFVLALSHAVLVADTCIDA